MTLPHHGDRSETTCSRAGSPRWIAGGILTAWLATGGCLTAQFEQDNSRPLVSVSGAGGGGGADLFGWRVAALGDVNADGVVDFAVSAPFFQVNLGRISVYSGADGTRLWRKTGTQSSDILGFELQSASDLDGDGVFDIAIGDLTFNAGAGRMFVYSGGFVLVAGSAGLPWEVTVTPLLLPRLLLSPESVLLEYDGLT